MPQFAAYGLVSRLINIEERFEFNLRIKNARLFFFSFDCRQFNFHYYSQIICTFQLFEQDKATLIYNFRFRISYRVSFLAFFFTGASNRSCYWAFWSDNDMLKKLKTTITEANQFLFFIFGTNRYGTWGGKLNLCFRFPMDSRGNLDSPMWKNQLT